MVDASRCSAGRIGLTIGRVFSAGLAGIALWLACTAAFADTKAVHSVRIDGVVDLGLAPLVARALDQAEAAGASALLLHIDTLGGRVDAATAIRDTLLRARIPTVAFIDKRAISAGALIALSASRIAMSEGSTIGAATPVAIGGPGSAPQPVSEKSVSYLRKEFRATAETRKRPPLIAEAMVDADVEIPGVIDKGKLLTLTTEEALLHKVADFRADDVEAVLAQLGLSGARVHPVAQNWAETLVRFLTHPVVASLLMTLGIIGIVTELRTPGFGVPGIVGASCLALFFWGHWLTQLAGLEELLLFLAGVLLLAVELFVLPGFGIAGVAGIAALVVALGLSLVGEGASMESLVEASWRVVISLLAAIAGALALLKWLPRLPVGRRLVLDDTLDAHAGWASAPEAEHALVGRRGIALSSLRPAGVAGFSVPHGPDVARPGPHAQDGSPGRPDASFEPSRVDVVSDGEFIDAGEPIEVIRVDGNRVVVRRWRDAPRET